MGFFDNLLAPFNTSSQDAAAAAQRNAIQAGMQQAGSTLDQGRTDIQNTYAGGLQPLKETYGSSTQGTDQLAKLLGFGGDPTSVLNSLRNTPGYQFTRDQGLEDATRTSAAAGFGTGPGGMSGNTLKALTDYGTGLADKTYQSAVSNLMPYLNYRAMTAGNIGNLSGQEAGLLSQNQNQLASMLYGGNVGQGNASAAAALAPLTAGQNIFGAIQQGAKLAASPVPGGGGTPTIGGEAWGGIKNLASGLFGGIPQSGQSLPNG